MFNRLSSKISLILLLILLLTIGTNSWLTSHMFVKEYTEALKSEVLVIGESLKLQLDRLLGLEIPLEDIMGFEEQCQEIISKYPMVNYALVVEPNGKILFHNEHPLFHHQLTIPQLQEAVKSNTPHTVTYRQKRRKFYGTIIPVFNTAGSHVGAVVLGFPETVISQKTNLYIFASTLVSLVFFSFSFFLITYALSLWVTKPIIKLDRFAHELGKKGFSPSNILSIKNHDEIGRLALSFNKMAVDLEKTTVSKDYMDNIISSMMDALIVTDSNLKIRTINNAAGVLLNYSPDELINQSINLIFPDPENSPVSGEKLAKIITQGGLKNYETVFRKKDGSKVPVLLSFSVMKEDNSTLKYIVCTSKDITERKQAEEELLLQTEKLTQTNRELQSFAYAASHDLQEPLRKIVAFSDRIIKKEASNLGEQSLDYFQRIQKATMRMQTLINNLLSYSRVTTQAQPFEKVKLDVVASEVLSDLETLIEQTQGKVEMEGLPEIEADPTQIRQLFQNLISNGLKFHRLEIAPSVKIKGKIVNATPNRLNGEGKFLELSFEDNGIGIEGRYFNRIFSVFQRLHGKDEYEGTGVGLSICHKIVERHHGQIRVESQIGIGSRFIVNLPLHQKRPSE